MNENLDLVKILKDCPKGTKLYCPLYGEVELQEVNNPVFSDYPINVITYHYTKQYPNGHPVLTKFTSDGRYSTYYKNDECVLFPSKDQHDWSKFQPKKPKFDPKTLQPFDKVLGFFNGVWNCDLYSHYYNDDRMFPYVCFRSCVNRIIPYNDDTKHLVGTANEAPEYYRYWED